MRKLDLYSKREQALMARALKRSLGIPVGADVIGAVAAVLRAKGRIDAVHQRRMNAILDEIREGDSTDWESVIAALKRPPPANDRPA